MRVIIDRGAWADLNHAADWYENKQAGLGHRFQTDFKDTVTKIAKYPEAFGIKEDLHAIPMKKFPYHIFYSLHTGDILILAVLAFRQNTKRLKKKGI